jgi:type IV pilus assembly protein PilV
MRGVVARGFTLVEVLVALFVLAIGMLGMAALQAQALRAGHESRLTSDAVQLASALAERMGANSAQMGLSDAANPYLQLRYDAALENTLAQGASACYGQANCSSVELAAFDMLEVKQALTAGFPGGRIAVCRDARIWDSAGAALGWDCSPAHGAPIVVKIGWRARQGNAVQADGRRQDGPMVVLAVADVAR